MEFIMLLPIIAVVLLLREAGLSWTAILLLWDVIICGMYWLIYVFDRRTGEKTISRKDKIVFAVITLATFSLTPLILINENSLTFSMSAILPFFTSSLWFVVRMLKE